MQDYFCLDKKGYVRKSKDCFQNMEIKKIMFVEDMIFINETLQGLKRKLKAKNTI